MWAQHRVNHIVPWFWQFHTVHHSQKEISFFTDFRYHALEYVVRTVYFSIVRRWYTRFYHANIKTDLGPLRYVVVTPSALRDVRAAGLARPWPLKNCDPAFGAAQSGSAVPPGRSARPSGSHTGSGEPHEGATVHPSPGNWSRHLESSLVDWSPTPLTPARSCPH